MDVVGVARPWARQQHIVRAKILVKLFIKDNLHSPAIEQTTVSESDMDFLCIFLLVFVSKYDDFGFN